MLVYRADRVQCFLPVVEATLRLGLRVTCISVSRFQNRIRNVSLHSTLACASLACLDVPIGGEGEGECSSNRARRMFAGVMAVPAGSYCVGVLSWALVDRGFGSVRSAPQ